MSLGGIYSTGTLTINTGDSVAVFSGALMTTQAEEGDWLFADGTVAIVGEATDDTHITITADWVGSNLIDSEYQLIKMSWLRYDPAILQQKVRQMLAALDQSGIIYSVTEAEPDPSLGEEGQYALKINEGAWKMWQKIDGVWILQATPAGVTPKGPYDADTSYFENDIVSYLGNAYISKVTPNLGNTPDSNPDEWNIFLEGGTRYDLAIWDNGRAVSGEVLWRSKFTAVVQFPENLINSQGDTIVTANAAAVYRLKKNDVEFATVTFNVGEDEPVFEGEATIFNPGDLLTVHAPDPQDETLSDTTITITGYH